MLTNNNKKKNKDLFFNAKSLSRRILGRGSQKAQEFEEEGNGDAAPSDSKKKQFFRNLGRLRRSASNFETPSSYPKFAPPANLQVLLLDNDEDNNNPPITPTVAIDKRKKNPAYPKHAPIPQEVPESDERKLEGRKIKNTNEGFKFPEVTSHPRHTTIISREGRPLPRQPSYSVSQVARPDRGRLPPRNLLLKFSTLKNISSITLTSDLIEMTSQRHIQYSPPQPPPLTELKFVASTPVLTQNKKGGGEEIPLPAISVFFDDDDNAVANDQFNQHDSMNTDNFAFATKRSNRALCRSSSFTDFEKLQQIQQALDVFPKISHNRVKQVLREKSFCSAMNVLAEESAEVEREDTDDFKPPPSITENKGAIVEENPRREANTTAVTAAVDNNHNNDDQVKQCEEENDNGLRPMIERLPSTLWRNSKTHHPIYPNLSNFDSSQISQKSLQVDDDEKTFNNNVVKFLLPNLPTLTRSKKARSNSFTSISTFDRDHVDLEQIQEIFPAVEPRRANYLLRQYSMSTVMVMLASENDT